MTWICLEGLDRSGKSSVAEHYKKLGYQIVHMSAPDKKYFKVGYNGESYLEEMVALYTQLDGKNVIFDRSTYGELIWPNVYSRLPMLSEEDIDYLAGIERNNNTERILMYDPNSEAHWQRCIDNNEPLTRQQFGRANIFYERLVKDYGFIKKQLSDFPGMVSTESKHDTTNGLSAVSTDEKSISSNTGNSGIIGNITTPNPMGTEQSLRTDRSDNSNVGSISDKLERANAIRALLQGTVLKKKGGAYDDLEQVVREFLQEQLDELFEGQKPKGDTELTVEEISILKIYVSRIREKMG